MNRSTAAPATGRTDVPITNVTITSRRLRGLHRAGAVTFGIAAALAATLAGPAAAVQHGSDDIGIEQPPGDDPLPPPAGASVSLTGTFQCDPEAGVTFDGQIANGPQRPHVPNVAWTLVGGGNGSVPGLAGSLDSEHGDTYELQATVFYPPLPQPGGGAVLPPITLTSDVVTVTVDCPGPDDGPGGSGGAGSGTSVLDDVVEATPTFTG